MKTNEEIMATWEAEGQYRDWYAIDSYNPLDGKLRRLFVGEEGEARDLLNSSYLNPDGLYGEPFYRLKVIGGDDALAYFKGEVHELEDERGLYSITEAAGILGVSRQRVHALVKAGQLDARKVGNTWSVYRHSVEARMGK